MTPPVSRPTSDPMPAATAANSTDATAPGRSHYVVLDGLRGVASLLVVVFHLLEAYTNNDAHRQIINHGYLAVDFFFVLSGFVIAYAYDDRWGRLTLWGFCERRLIRLQPMVVAGSVIGALLLPLQHYSIFPALGHATLGAVLLVALIGCTLIPLPASADIRGWGETYPLNGPAWSLFYEYVANLAYALGLRRLPVRWLALFVAVAAVALIHFAVTNERGDLIGGWSLDWAGIRVGLTRVTFPFFAGVLLTRVDARLHTRHGFALASVLVVAALAAPRIGGVAFDQLNGLYDALCVILVFPLVVAIGAGEKRVDGVSVRIARFFGELSYPLYITHYPLIYIYTGWVVDNHVSAARGAVVGGVTFLASVAIAYGCLKLYDEPARRWLATKVRGRPTHR